MPEATLKIPADQIEAFRTSVYGEFASNGSTLDTKASALAYPGGRSWAEQIADDDAQNVKDNIERYAVEVLIATRKIAALVEAMRQLGWTDPIKGDVELTGDAELLASLVEDAIVDVGDTIDDITDARPFDRQAFEAQMQRGVWLADQRDVLASGVEAAA